MRSANRKRNIIGRGMVLFILITGFFQGGSPALYAKTLVVGAIWFPPFYTIEKNQMGQVTGISGLNVEIISRVLDRMGRPYVLKFYPAKRLYRNLIKGTTDIFYGIRIPHSLVSSEHILHSQTTINRITLRVFHLEKTLAIENQKNLIGNSVIVFRGYGYGGFIEFLRNPSNQVEIFVADTQINGFKMLKKERAKYLIAFERPAFEAMKQFPQREIADIVYSPPLFMADGYFIVSSKTPKAKKLLTEMEDIYHQLRDQGMFEGLISDPAN